MVSEIPGPYMFRRPLTAALPLFLNYKDEELKFVLLISVV